jgi:uncharacterized RDD family membrane protein YckC
MRYYIGKNGQQLGPFDGQQIRDQLNTGALSHDDLCWREGMAAWVPLRGEFPPGAPGEEPPAVPVFPGAAPANPFLSAVTREAPSAEPQLADRGKRLAAVILDTLLALLVAAPGLALLFAGAASSGGLDEAVENETFPFEFGAPLLLMLVPLLGFLIYQIYLLTTRGQTLGKRLLKIRIVRTDGSKPGFVHAVLLRSVVMQFIGAIPFVGGIVSFVDPLLIFREDRRCLHDMIADTTVIDV